MFLQILKKYMRYIKSIQNFLESVDSVPCQMQGHMSLFFALVP